jgi:hypothetical protein
VVSASARTRSAALPSSLAARATLRSWRSLYWRTRLAEVVPIKAISGAVITIRPFTRIDRSSHHRFSGRCRPAAPSAEPGSRGIRCAPVST